jgi:hypothetical protein
MVGKEFFIFDDVRLVIVFIKGFYCGSQKVNGIRGGRENPNWDTRLVLKKVFPVRRMIPTGIAQ